MTLFLLITIILQFQQYFPLLFELVLVEGQINVISEDSKLLSLYYLLDIINDDYIYKC